MQIMQMTIADATSLAGKRILDMLNLACKSMQHLATACSEALISFIAGYPYE